MRRTALLAAAVGGLFATSSFAAFTFSIGTPNTSLVAGKQFVPLYVLNDGVGGTGTSLAAFAPTLTAVGGQFYVNIAQDPDTGDFLPDPINSGGPSGVAPAITNAGNGSSVLRVGSATATFAASVTPSAASAYVGGKIVSYSTALTTTGAKPAAGASVNGGLGYRAGILVLDASATAFTLGGSVGGESGSAVTIAPQTFNLGPTTTTNAAPTVVVAPSTLTIDVSPVGPESGSALITAADTDGTIASLVRSGAPLALADNITETGTNPKTFSLAGLNYTDIGTYTFTYTATDNLGATGTGTLTVNIVPEPASLSLIGLAGLGMIRRRK